MRDAYIARCDLGRAKVITNKEKDIKGNTFDRTVVRVKRDRVGAGCVHPMTNDERGGVVSRRS